MTANPNLYIYDRDVNVTGTIPGTFTHVPSYGSMVSFEAKNSGFESSDNYFFVAPVGINHLRPKFDFKFENKKEDDAREIVGFMENLRGTDTFLYTDPANIYSPIDLTCVDISHSIMGNDTASVDLSLESESYASLLKWGVEVISSSSNNIRGNWITGTAYSKFDVVIDTSSTANLDERFYYCKADVTSSTPPKDDPTNWTRSFFFEPTHPMTMKKETSVIKNEFRKSFSVRDDYGFHANALKDFEVSFNGVKDNETRAILHFLINRQGYRRFRFAPKSFYNQNKVFIATKWQHTYVHHDVNEIRITMTEDPLGIAT